MLSIVTFLISSYRTLSLHPLEILHLLEVFYYFLTFQGSKVRLYSLSLNRSILELSFFPTSAASDTPAPVPYGA
jgi:hypothetical protein